MDGYDAQRFREVMGRFPTGVTVVAVAGEDGTPWGLTVNSFTSVSLDPPLVLVCIDRTATSHERMVRAGSFAISILSSAQAEIAERFATERGEYRFDHTGWTPAESGNPLIDGSCAWLDCALHRVFEGGDHSILVGRVTALEAGIGDPLVFHRGFYGSVET